MSMSANDLADRRRLLLATLAAENIVGDHPSDFNLAHVEQLVQHSTTALIEDDLNYLEENGLLTKYNTGGSYLADSYIEGQDVWFVTRLGFVTLWTAP